MPADAKQGKKRTPGAGWCARWSAGWCPGWCPGWCAGWCAVWLLLLACGCGGEPAYEPRCGELRWDGAPRAVPLILIVSDTMRRDRLGIYGGPAETPAFDGFAERNLWFDRAFTQAPWTKPSIATLFTSLYPSQHQVLSHPTGHGQNEGEGEAPAPLETDVLAPGFTTLAEVLRDAGWRTGAVVANPWLVTRLGFDQGFDTYDDSFASWSAPGDRIVDRGLEWISEQDPDTPFFLYLHLMDSHQPYPELGFEALHEHADRLANDRRALTPFARRHILAQVRLEGGARPEAAAIQPSLALLELAYDQGVEQFDRALGRFLAGLREHPAAAGAAIVVTADHGEALFTRGYGNHGQGLFDDEVAIPMAAKLPGVSADESRVGCAIGLVDMMPTLCSYLGVGCAEPVFGRSLLAAADGPAPAFQLVEGVGNHPAHRAIVDERHKLLFEPDGGPLRHPGDTPWSMYDRSADPAESRDLLADPSRDESTRQAFESLSTALANAVPAHAAPESEPAPLDPDLAERLKALGYIDPEAGEDTGSAAPR